MSSKLKITMQLAEAAKAIAGKLIGDDLEFVGVSTDTRTIQTGELFVALRGPNFDGHEYAQQAIASGAVAVMADHEMPLSVPVVVVDDTRIGLGKLANTWRNEFSIPVIGVTGSNGKTTVKEMLASIFSMLGEVHATKGNLNNDIGVPLTLFELGQQHKTAVIEMGANHQNEIAYLTEVAQPDVTVITCAAAAHLEGFGSLEGVAHAKGEIYQGLSDKGIAVINADDTFAPLWREFVGARQKIEFGLDGQRDVTATYKPTAAGNQLSVTTPKGEIEINLPLYGRHNVMNALAATSVATVLNVSLENIKSGLEKMQSVPGRLQIKLGINKSRLIDDTYNANPSSVTAALDVLGDFDGQHFMALGDMGELGSDEQELHRKVGEQARAKGVNKLYTIGKLAEHAAKEFGDFGYSFDAHASMIEAISKDLNKDSTLLVKGSRRSHMERVVEALTIEERV
ncbi:MAG: UDP-N-acetylmuramoyl-tripeptide--D-alanyl-D-alanine ligase [Gammaproteobacteria bacterium]|nr:UDP-N-acetylmuramoyl-tripeptide--D-alanyl-D-alanine ligase [Gammaproteobacteria bacterium]